MNSGSITSRLPPWLKRRVPALRERDDLRREVGELRARVHELDAAAATARPDAGVHGVYVGDGKILVATTWGGRLLVPAEDLSITPELVAYGSYDRPFTAFIRAHIQPGDTVFDIGANVGLFTLLAAYEVWEMGHVIAYEAHPRVLEFLRDNVSLGWLHDRVQIVPKAAGAAPGVLPFLAPRRFLMNGSLQPIEDFLVTETKRDSFERIEVEVEPLDVHVGRFERIDLIKIDVEGAEEQVFAGMERLLDSGVVRRVSFEVDRSHVGDDWDPFARRLHALSNGGWQFATIAESGLTEPISVEQVTERGRFPQVVMSRGPG